MIDPTDKQTVSLPLEEKRGRGRPATGKPRLSAAEKQRRYRERKAAQVQESGFDVAGLKRAYEELQKRYDEVYQGLVTAEATLMVLNRKLELATRKKKHRDDPPIDLNEAQYGAAFKDLG